LFVIDLLASILVQREATAKEHLPKPPKTNRQAPTPRMSIIWGTARKGQVHLGTCLRQSCKFWQIVRKLSLTVSFAYRIATGYCMQSAAMRAFGSCALMADSSRVSMIRGSFWWVACTLGWETSPSTRSDLRCNGAFYGYTSLPGRVYSRFSQILLPTRTIFHHVRHSSVLDPFSRGVNLDCAAIS
jgi:hypothetical protein